jgi:hypothetical protein
VDGEVVWFWHPDAGVKSVEDKSAGDGGKRAGHRGDHEVNRKTLRGECRSVSDVTVAFFFYVQAAAHLAPGTPAPSDCFRGRTNPGKLEHLLRDREVVSEFFYAVIPGRCNASNPESRDSGFALGALRNDEVALRHDGLLRGTVIGRRFAPQAAPGRLALVFLASH